MEMQKKLVHASLVIGQARHVAKNNLKSMLSLLE